MKDNLKIPSHFSYDALRYHIVTARGKTIRAGRDNCYANTILNVNWSKVTEREKNIQLKFYDVYWADAVSHHLKDTKTTRSYLRLLKKTGLLDNVKVTLLPSKNLPEDVIKTFRNIDAHCNYWLRVRSDVDKVTAQEMFLVGLAIRTVSNSPEVIPNFIRLCKMYQKKYAIDHLLFVAHVLSWGDSGIWVNGGHSISPATFSYISGKTFKDFRQRVAVFPMLRNSTTYGLPESIFSYFTSYHSSGVTKWGLDNVYRFGGTKWSRGAIKSFFDKEEFIKLYNKGVTFYCRNS